MARSEKESAIQRPEFGLKEHFNHKVTVAPLSKLAHFLFVYPVVETAEEGITVIHPFVVDWDFTTAHVRSLTPPIRRAFYSVWAQTDLRFSDMSVQDAEANYNRNEVGITLLEGLHLVTKNPHLLSDDPLVFPGTEITLDNGIAFRPAVVKRDNGIHITGVLSDEEQPQRIATRLGLVRLESW